MNVKNGLAPDGNTMNGKKTDDHSDLLWMFLAKLCFISTEEMSESELNRLKNKQKKKPPKFYSTVHRIISTKSKQPDFTISSDFKKMKYETEFINRKHKHSYVKPKFFDSPMQPENKSNFYPSPLGYSSHYRSPFRYNNDDPGYFFGDYKGLSGEAMMRMTKYDHKKYNPALMM